MSYLLDTCVLSELVKPAPEPAVLRWMAARQEQTLFVSAMTLAELHRGVAKLPVSRRRTELSNWLEKLENSFEERVLPFGQSTAKPWAAMCARADAAGATLAAFDSIIAATALEHGLTVVTRNVRDFAHTLVPVMNPWSEAG
ncbi:MAG: type II toxin-antitoxin system VapC family toxin [Pseudomonadota bacterium]